MDIIKLSNLLRVISPTLPDLLNLKLATMPILIRAEFSALDLMQMK